MHEEDENTNIQQLVAFHCSSLFTSRQEEEGGGMTKELANSCPRYADCYLSITIQHRPDSLNNNRQSTVARPPPRPMGIRLIQLNCYWICVTERDSWALFAYAIKFITTSRTVAQKCE